MHILTRMSKKYTHKPNARYMQFTGYESLIVTVIYIQSSYYPITFLDAPMIVHCIKLLHIPTRDVLVDG